MEGLAKKHGSAYTQYVDDTTFSGPIHIAHLNPLINKIINQEGFTANISKTKVMGAGQEQVVTGVKVNQGADVPSLKIREVRKQIDKFKLFDKVDGNSWTIRWLRSQVKFGILFS